MFAIRLVAYVPLVFGLFFADGATSSTEAQRWQRGHIWIPGLKPGAVRSKPRWERRFIRGFLHHGTNVNIGRCGYAQGVTFCYVRKGKLHGWMDAAVLRRGRYRKPRQLTAAERKGHRNLHCCYWLNFRGQTEEPSLGTYPGQQVTLNPKNTWGHIVYTIDVPDGFMGTVTLVRFSGDGDMDLEVGTGKSPGKGKAKISGLVGKSTRLGGGTEVVTIPPVSKDTRFYIHVYSVDKKAWKGKVYLRRANVFGTFLGSAVQAAIIHSVGKALGDLGGGETGRAAGERLAILGFSVLSRETLLQSGIDVAMGELQVELEKQFPGEHNRLGINFAVTLMNNFVQNLYKPAILHAAGKLR